MLLKPQSLPATRSSSCARANKAFTNNFSARASPRSVAAMAQGYKNLVIGGGNAAGYVAKEFVAGGLKAGELAILSEEAVCAYERPALSKAYLAPPEGAARLPGFHTSVGGGGERQTPDWYKEKGIDYHLNTIVKSVDVKGKTVTAVTGEKFSFEKLLYAAGARVVKLSDFNVPGSDLGGLYYLRNTADADALVAAIQGTKAAGGKAVVVGGGYIGMEVAAQLAGNGVPCTIVCPEPHLLARLFTPKIAAFYENFYATKGITIAKNSVTAFEGADGKVSHVVLKDGQKLEAPLVVVGVGARPNVELLEGQVETVPKPVGGIKVDGFMATSAPDVYAVGDVAAFPLKMGGNKLVRQEHVVNSRQSATQAVQAIQGRATSEYDYLPYFYSRVFNLSWQFWGSSEGAEVAHFGDFEAGKFGAYFVKDGKVTGVFLESATPEEQEAAKKVAREQPAAASVAELEGKGISFATSRM